VKKSTRTAKYPYIGSKKKNKSGRVLLFTLTTWLEGGEGGDEQEEKRRRREREWTTTTRRRKRREWTWKRE
jgi:hypothetical protein